MILPTALALAVMAAPVAVVDEAMPLAGRVVVVDPGHQLGNGGFPGRLTRPVPAGGFEKPCNTTGTATPDGFPEATLNWRVARAL